MIKSIILLSGGLDSLVSMGLCREKYNITLALTFDYGQKAASKEAEAAANICKYYNTEHKIINLDMLKSVTHTSLVSEEKIPQKDDLIDGQSSMKSVWVPNRNGLFLNIAACYADGNDYDYIIIGANKEEGETFSDNTSEFIESVNNMFEFSTLKKPRVIAPLINYTKNDIVKHALEKKIPLELTRSCYLGREKHCGECESCVRLKKALLFNNDNYYVKKLF